MKAVRTLLPGKAVTKPDATLNNVLKHGDYRKTSKTKIKTKFYVHANLKKNSCFTLNIKEGKCGRAKMCKFGNNTVEKITLKIAIN